MHLPGIALTCYLFILDRSLLSKKNSWVDKNGHVFCIFPEDELAKKMSCSVRTVHTAIKSLREYKLIVTTRTDFSKANRIYVLYPYRKKSADVVGKDLPLSGEDFCPIDGQETADVMGKNLPTINNNAIKTEITDKEENQKRSYGRYKNVWLTEDEYQALKADISDLDELANKMSIYCQANGKTYSDYAAALLSWHQRNQNPAAITIDDSTDNDATKLENMRRMYAKMKQSSMDTS